MLRLWSFEIVRFRDCDVDFDFGLKILRPWDFDVGVRPLACVSFCFFNVTWDAPSSLISGSPGNMEQRSSFLNLILMLSWFLDFEVEVDFQLYSRVWVWFGFWFDLLVLLLISIFDFCSIVVRSIVDKCSIYARSMFDRCSTGLDRCPVNVRSIPIDSR